MKYINTFREGERIADVYLVKSKKRAETKAGKPYDNVVLQDKTGTIEAKIWDVGSAGIEEFDALDYVYVGGDVSIFMEKPQLTIRRAKVCQPGEYDPTDYLPVSEHDIEQMYTELLGFVDSVHDIHYHAVLEGFFKNPEIKKAFCFHSAAKSVHHGFVGGLLEHSLSVTRNCDFFAKNYPILDRDLLVTAAMLHDIGKIKELSKFPENDYTDAGQLLGHIVIGAEWVGEVIRTIADFPVSKANQLKHCILAHHGEMEFGSPKKPALVEALALSFADNVDAKMETWKETMSTVAENDYGWQGFNRFLDTNIRRTES
ncbi:MAG: HD domain-containing protein [Agathobacter sp.]|uniref:3'-5' exoribonuclease YhaM family protein n=1 Tax=Agathobacter sp. TaxID=2021311 RepID=UPI00257FFCFC|nr:HD domain-containing protein [Agathobacter sp.]MBQ1681121.1 HD domain-containing protein [Agathobacter sp.]